MNSQSMDMTQTRPVASINRDFFSCSSSESSGDMPALRSEVMKLSSLLTIGSGNSTGALANYGSRGCCGQAPVLRGFVAEHRVA
jgi:hypothetical protein